MNQAGTNVPGGKRLRVEHEAHRLVAWLQTKGFIIVPEPPARRARATKPKPYTGPAMIGQSHIARLIGGAS